MKEVNLLIHFYIFNSYYFLTSLFIDHIHLCQQNFTHKYINYISAVLNLHNYFYLKFNKVV